MGINVTILKSHLTKGQFSRTETVDFPPPSVYDPLSHELSTSFAGLDLKSLLRSSSSGQSESGWLQPQLSATTALAGWNLLSVICTSLYYVSVCNTKCVLCSLCYSNKENRPSKVAHWWLQKIVAKPPNFSSLSRTCVVAGESWLSKVVLSLTST